MHTIEKVVKRGNQWCVIHCHGADAGKAIKCFDTEGEAQAMHAAIQANRQSFESRHPDFQKIYDQFLMVPEGKQRYDEWIAKLNIDESRPYGNCFRESWYHRHVDFKLWKEDARNTYWKIEVGFPVESMNRNVYSKQELMMASRTLKGGYVNLNHKFRLPTITIPASEAVTHIVTLPDGTQTETVITEAVVKVPNNLQCPICDKSKTINQLIKEGGIVNVSLESSCNYISGDNKCEGMEYDGFAFLTSKVLPGIPLTRIQPLEGIMVEALGANTTPMRVNKMLKLEVMEEECPEGQQWDSEKETCVPTATEMDCPEGQKMNPESGKCEQMDTKGMTDKAVLPDQAGQCPDGMIFSTVMGQCVPDKQCPDGSHFDDKTQQCVPDTTAMPAKSVTAVGSSPTPSEMDGTVPKMVAGDPSIQPIPKVDIPATGPTKDVKVPQIPTDEPAASSELPAGTPPYPVEPTPTDEPSATAHQCPDGYSWGHDSNMCVPSDPITERIGRMKAEDKARYFEQNALQWQKRASILENALNTLRGTIGEQKTSLTKLQERTDRYNLSKVEDEIKYREMKRRVEDLTLDLDETRRKLAHTTTEYQSLARKYEDSQSTNLELAKRNTTNNEDYLKLAEKAELLEAKIAKQRIHAKKILKIRA